MDTIYVLNRDGRPLMPMHSWGRVQRFLKSGRASVVSSLPFTIRLKKQIEDPELDRCILGIDPGRTNIGLCVTDGKGKRIKKYLTLCAIGNRRVRHPAVASGRDGRDAPYTLTKAVKPP